MPQLYTEVQQKPNSVHTWSNLRAGTVSVQQSKNGEIKYKEVKYNQIVDPHKIADKYKD